MKETNSSSLQLAISARDFFSEMKNKNGKCITKLFDNSDKKFTQGVLWSIL